jgi:hypothetical protein
MKHILIAPVCRTEDDKSVGRNPTKLPTNSAPLFFPFPGLNCHESETTRFAAHLYQSGREYRRASETADESGKQIERSVITSFQVAESMGFKGEFRQ